MLIFSLQGFFGVVGVYSFTYVVLYVGAILLYNYRGNFTDIPRVFNGILYFSCIIGFVVFAGKHLNKYYHAKMLQRNAIILSLIIATIFGLIFAIIGSVGVPGIFYKTQYPLDIKFFIGIVIAVPLFIGWRIIVDE